MNISHRFFLFFGIILAVLIGVFILVMSSNTLLRNETGKMSQTLDLSVEQIVFNNSLNTLARKTSTTLRQISLLGYADRLENVQRVKGNFVDQLKDIRNQVSALSQNAVLSKDRGLFSVQEVTQALSDLEREFSSLIALKEREIKAVEQLQASNRVTAALEAERLEVSQRIIEAEKNRDDVLERFLAEYASMTEEYGRKLACPEVIEQINAELDAFEAAGGSYLILAAASGAEGYDARPVLDEAGWQELGLDAATAAFAMQFMDQLEEQGVPLLDNLASLPLLEEPGDRIAAARAALAALPPGLTHFIIHPAADSPELRAITTSWQSRVADYRAFTSDELARWVKDSGIQVIGYRPLRDLMRP